MDLEGFPPILSNQTPNTANVILAVSPWGISSMDETETTETVG